MTTLMPTAGQIPDGWGQYADSFGDALTLATMGWLAAQESTNTREAYQRNLLGLGPTWQPAPGKGPAWLPWCHENSIDPLTARRSHVDAWARMLEQAGLAAKSRAQKLSAVSSWYSYLISEDLTERNPARDASRPKLAGNYVSSSAFSWDEMNRLLDIARSESPRTEALIDLLYFGAFRVGSVLGAEVGDYGWASHGKRGLLLHLKGGKTRREPLGVIPVHALDAYLATRPGAGDEEPLLATATGKRLYRKYVHKLVRRLCRAADIPSWQRANPHWLRATHITHALDSGVALEIVQRTAHHVDGRTTQGYDDLREVRQERSGTALERQRERYVAEHVVPPAGGLTEQEVTP